MKLSTGHSVTPGHRYALFYVFMQTRDQPVLDRDHTRIGRCPFIAGVLALLLLAASCSPVHLEAINTQRSRSTCEAAYDIASRDHTLAFDGRYPLTMRYLAASQASAQWTRVASQCSQRFAEGTLRSAQARWQQSSLAQLLGLHNDDDTVTLDGLKASKGDSTAWSAMALAEDRAGFSMEVLAARHQDDAMLRVSDEHKTTAQTLVTASGASPDPRQKVYDVRQLIEHPDTISETATGWSVPTASVVEIDCAREELAAMPTTKTPIQSTGSDNDTATGATRHLQVISRLISQRVYQSFAYGYPSIDAGLFQPVTDSPTSP